MRRSATHRSALSCFPYNSFLWAPIHGGTWTPILLIDATTLLQIKSEHLIFSLLAWQHSPSNKGLLSTLSPLIQLSPLSICLVLFVRELGLGPGVLGRTLRYQRASLADTAVPSSIVLMQVSSIVPGDWVDFSVDIEHLGLVRNCLPDLVRHFSLCCPQRPAHRFLPLGDSKILGR